MGGRVSDKHITENSGVLRKLLPGDIVLAVRGFDIADSVGFYQAKLYIPAFTKGNKQLSAQEVKETRNCKCKDPRRMCNWSSSQKVCNPAKNINHRVGEGKTRRVSGSY